MQTTDKNTEETISAVKSEFERAKDRLAKTLATTPDDKIAWSPSATARTPLHIAAHAAMSIGGIQDWLLGKPFPWKDMTEADREWRKMEQAFTTREQVNELLDSNAAKYIAFLEGITPEFLGSTFSMGFAEFPMASAITFCADHLRGHAAQMEYVQTIYGDLDWHMS